MTATTTTVRRALWATPLAIGFSLSLALAANAQTQGCVQKTDGDQFSSGPHLAQQAAAGQTYTAQKTAGGGMPQALINSEQPNPKFPNTSAQASNQPCPPKG